jgi:peroxiredoxin
LAPVESATVPRPSPEYVIKLTTGQQLLLSQYRGNVVALAFVSTTCPHCKTTTQFLEQLHKQYGSRGFQPIAVAFNPMAVMLVPDFAKQLGLTFPVGYDARDPVFEYLQRSPMLRTFVPIMVFIDRNGTIRGQYLGDDKFFTANQDKNIRTIVEQLLKEPAGSKGAASSSKARSTKKSS